jgi:hypothetical protein
MHFRIFLMSLFCIGWPGAAAILTGCSGCRVGNGRSVEPRLAKKLLSSAVQGCRRNGPQYLGSSMMELIMRVQSKPRFIVSALLLASVPVALTAQGAPPPMPDTTPMPKEPSMPAMPDMPAKPEAPTPPVEPASPEVMATPAASPAPVMAPMAVAPPPSAQAVYPPCSKTLQDQCTNVREGTRTKRVTRRKN